MGWMAHRKWKYIKQQPSMLPGPAVPGSCLASFHFRWAIHPVRPVVVKLCTFTTSSRTNCTREKPVTQLRFRVHATYASKVATYRHMYRAEPKEPTQFGSVSASEIQNLPFSNGVIVSLYRSEPKEPTQFGSVTGLYRLQPW